MTVSQRGRVFISYSHEDQRWFEQLTQAFEADRRNGRVDLWTDLDLIPGTEFQAKIEAAIDAARVAVLLVSPSFLDSEFIRTVELPRILAAVDDGLTLLWIPLEGSFYGPEAHPGAEQINHLQAFCPVSQPFARQDVEQQRLTLHDLCKRMDELFGRQRIIRNLPFATLGDLFKGRESELAELEQHLARDGAAAITQPKAITGQGGRGKTRLAIEYAWRHQHRFSALLFVSAKSSDELTANLARLSAPEALDLREYRLGQQPEQYEAVLRWLSERHDWLLIVDNADTREAVHAVQDLLPRLHGGQVLVTSRLSGWAGVQALPLDLLSEEDAVEYLLQKTAATRQPLPGDAEEARGLARELGRLALALEQAAAYIAKRGISLAEYRSRWQSQYQQLLTWYDAEKMQYPLPVGSTYLTSFEQLSPQARRLLRMLAWMAPDPVPVALLAAKGGPFAAAAEPEEMPEEQWPAAVDQAEEALGELVEFSLAARTPDKSAFTVHNLVQLMARLNTPAEEAEPCFKAALGWLNHGIPFDADDVRFWPQIALLLPHGLVLCTEAESRAICDPAATILHQLAVFLHFAARYKEAEPLICRARALLEAHGQETQADYAATLSLQALLLKATNRLAEAEPLYRRALALLEQSHGKDHPDVANSLNNLAELLRATNRLDEAELLMRRALAIHEQSYGKEHPDVAASLNNLASLLRATNRLAEAEQMHRRALAIREQSYGKDHPDVATSLNNLALLLEATNRLAEAEQMHRRALAIREQSYGKEHPDVAISLNNLALLLEATNRLDEAEQMHRRALAIREQSYGKDHPTVATSLNNLALLLVTTNRLAEAEQMHRRALAIREQSYGLEHPEVATDLNNLAGLLYATNRQAEALPLMRRAVSILEASQRKNGHEDPNLKIAQAGLAAMERKPVSRRAVWATLAVLALLLAGACWLLGKAGLWLLRLWMQ